MARPPGVSTESGKTQRGIQSVEVGGRLLQALADARRPLALAELAAAAQIAPAQAHTYLVSLTRLGLIKRDHLDGGYEPGPLALRLGMLHLDHQPAYRAAVPRVQALAREIGCNMAISLPTAQGPTIVHYVPAGTPLHVNLHVGTVMALAATATGRTYCAFQPDIHWQPIWRQQQPIASPDALARFASTLEPIRQRGMEHSIDTPSPAVSSLAMPLIGAGGVLRLVLTAIGSTGTIDVDWHGPVARAMRAALDAIPQTPERA
ncbi:IclR family transcriptional regulator [Cupriavidus agavae]|uniref:IclR family transcriptional regulator n=1 Tax=Cupriavidus agavae TaxID=1001822 RepID=A0A4Q7S9U4_9BURK|nr:helix-turn-helix domain-containing protein [Cupriavidus agavae]RZT43195.1 IclR family transcriptional regulator [Cupriavidus agavae]